MSDLQNLADQQEIYALSCRYMRGLQEPLDGLSSTESFYIRSENGDKLCLERANQSCLVHCG